MVGSYPLRLGSITFDAPFEGPNGYEEGLGDLGSTMMCVIKEFPGGTVTAQLQGSVPKEIPLKGRLYGAYARARSFELQRLCDEGELLTLSYAEWSLQGIVRDYMAHVKGPNEVWFTILFRPLVNNSTAPGGSASLPNTDPFSATVSSATQTMSQQATAPANGFQMPSGVQQSVSNLSSSITQQVQSNGGNVATLPLTAQLTLQNQIANLVNQLAPYVNGTDPVAAAAAAELTNTLGVLKTAFTQNISLQQLDKLNVVNPDLFQIAAFYYGDPNKWDLIATASNAAALQQATISDAYPLGSYTLIIPADNTFSVTDIPTVMTDALAKAS